MSNNNPFVSRPNRATDELMRHESARTDLMRHALGSAYNLQNSIGAIKGTLGHFSELQKSVVSGELERSMQTVQGQLKSLKNLTAPDWASAIQETALGISRYDNPISKQLQSFGTGVFGTAMALQSQSSVLAAAMAASKWQDQFKAIADQLSPSLMALRGTAERMAMMDMHTLSASAEHFQAGVMQATAQQAIEAQHIIEAFAQVDTPEEGAKLFAAFIMSMATILGHFKGNTIEELRKLGLFGIVGIVSAFYAFFPSEPPQGQTPEQQQAFAEMRTQIDTLQSQLHELLVAEDALNEAYVSELPRAKLERKSNIRSSPARDAPKILVAEPGTLVAVARSESRWKLVIFRDPLTDQLSQGWVYGTSVTMLENN